MDEQDEEIKKAIRTAALSGGISGGALGAIGSIPSLLKGGGWRAAALKTLLAGGVGAGLGAGTIGLGSKIMGAPDPQESSGYTRRGAVGGAVGGGIAGGALGGFLGATKTELPKVSPEVLSSAATRLRALSRGGKIGAVAGGLGLGAIAGYLGADEGTHLDFLENEMKEAKRRQMLRETYGV